MLTIDESLDSIKAQLKSIKTPGTHSLTTDDDIGVFTINWNVSANGEPQLDVLTVKFHPPTVPVTDPTLPHELQFLVEYEQ